MRALHEFTNVSGSSADLDASDRNYSVAAAQPDAVSGALRTVCRDVARRRGRAGADIHAA